MPAEAALVAYLDPLVTETAGTDLFEGPMPEFPDNCVAVAHYDSQAPEGRVMGASLSDNAGLWPVSVQVMARNVSKTTAEARCRAYLDLLDNLGPVTLSGVLYHSCEADGEPFNMGQDQGGAEGQGRWRFAFNLTCRKARG